MADVQEELGFWQRLTRDDFILSPGFVLITDVFGLALMALVC